MQIVASTKRASPGSDFLILGVALSAILAEIMVLILVDWDIVFAIGLTGAFVTGGYILLKPSYIRAFHLMIVTLPLLAAFVIDIGGNLRVPYYFAIIALLLGIYQMRLRVPRMNAAIWVLVAFVGYAFVSVVLVAKFDLTREVISYGFRTSTYRPIIQAGQLGLMIVFFYLTINYLTSAKRLLKISRLLTWSLMIVVLYGTYEVASAVYDLPFLNVNTNPDFIENRFAGTQTVTAGDITMPRPRSILVEPTPLATYVLFTVPFAFAVLAFTRNTFARWLILICITLAVGLFLLTWSRAAFVAALVVVPLTFILLRTGQAKLKMLLLGAIGYILMAVVAFPVLGAETSITLPFNLVSDRVADVNLVPGAIRLDDSALAQIGRDYATSLEIFKENPVTGAGLGNYFFALADLRDRPIEASVTGSLFLEILSQLGIIGMSLFLLFLTLVVGKLGRFVAHHKHCNLRPFAVASLISIVGVMVVGLGAGGGLTTISFVWVMFAIGVVIPQLPCECKAFKGRLSNPKNKLRSDRGLNEPQPQSDI